MKKGIVRNKNALTLLETIAANPRITSSRLCQLLIPSGVDVPHVLAGLKDMELVSVNYKGDWPKDELRLTKGGRKILHAANYPRTPRQATA